MTVGSHGSTYGGNPLAMAVGLAAFDELTKLSCSPTCATLPATSASSSRGLRIANPT